MKKNILVDILIVLLIIAALGAGYFTYKHFRQTGDKQIEKTSKIAFQIFLRGVTITGTENPIKAGDKTFISIRNVPYTDLEVVDTKIDTKKIVMPNPAGKPPFILVQDFGQIFMYDIIVTVVDKAKITKDGAVVGGNKIKIGLPITIEGKDYKFNGTVSNLQILPETQPQQPSVPMQPSTQVQPKAPVQPTAPQPETPVQPQLNIPGQPAQPQQQAPVQPNTQGQKSQAQTSVKPTGKHPVEIKK